MRHSRQVGGKEKEERVEYCFTVALKVSWRKTREVRGRLQSRCGRSETSATVTQRWINYSKDAIHYVRRWETGGSTLKLPLCNGRSEAGGSVAWQ